MIPIEPQPLPDLTGIRIFIAAGQRDPVVPPGQTQRLAALLESGGAEVESHTHAGGHELGRDDLTAAAQWLSKLS